MLLALSARSCVDADMYLYTCASTHIYVYIYIYIYIYTHVLYYIKTCITYMYVYIYICTEYLGIGLPMSMEALITRMGLRGSA